MGLHLWRLRSGKSGTIEHREARPPRLWTSYNSLECRQHECREASNTISESEALPDEEPFQKGNRACDPCTRYLREKVLPGLALSLVGPAEESLVLTLPGLSLHIDTVAVSYSVDSYLYTFEARATDALVDRDRAVTLLTMGLPERIARIERRKSPRVTCSRQDAAAVRLASGTGSPSGARSST